MKDINDFMPKIRGLRWGALFNYMPSNPELKQINKLLPHNGKWHTILQDNNQIHVDGHPIRRRTAKSMT